jgi:hypothetical protein
VFRDPVRLRLVALALIAVGLGLLVSGCGGGGGGGGDDGATTSAKTSASTTTRRPAANPVKVISATLNGTAAIPKGAATGKGSATVTLNTRSGRACWKLTVSGIDKPLSAHIHEGAVGKVGQVVIPLGDTFSRRGCVLSGPRTLRLVAAAPTGYYIDVHTTKFLDGAVRGQLRAASA